MTTLKRLEERLNNITRLVTQVDQGIISNIEVQKSHPGRLANAEKLLRQVEAELALIRQEDEVGIAHWDEISDALPVVIDGLADQMTMVKNLSFLQAADRGHLKKFLFFLLEHGLDLFEEIFNEMPAGDQEKLRERLFKK